MSRTRIVSAVICLVFGALLTWSWYKLGLGMYLYALGGGVMAWAWVMPRRSAVQRPVTLFWKLATHFTALACALCGLVFVAEWIDFTLLLAAVPALGAAGTAALLWRERPELAPRPVLLTILLTGFAGALMILRDFGDLSCTCCAWDEDGLCEFAGTVGIWWLGMALTGALMPESPAIPADPGPADTLPPVTEILAAETEAQEAPATQDTPPADSPA